MIAQLTMNCSIMVINGVISANLSDENDDGGDYDS